jgi:hypothetical protein
MPQDQDTLEKELRRQMREGRTPLLDTIRFTYQPYLLAWKSWQRKNSELREQVGLLNSTFNASAKHLRNSSRNAQESGGAMVDMYRELSKQAKAVSALIEKELPNLVKLYEPAGELYTAYEQALHAYQQYMSQWQGRLPESDLSGRALELVIDEINKSLR